MAPIYECSLRVEAHEADCAGRLRVSSVFNHLQNLAAVHAERLGAGIAEVFQQGLIWVLSWAKLEFAAFPRLGEAFSARTWPKCRHKAFFVRDFLFSGGNGEVFCRATTAWLLVDVKTKKAVPLHRLREGIPQLEGEHALPSLPERLEVAGEGRSVFTRQVRYCDLDVNRHVNNARFIELLMDCYPANHYREHRMESMTVAFVAEAKEGDVLDLRLHDSRANGDGDFLEIRNVRSGKPVVQALLEWRSPPRG